MLMLFIILFNVVTTFSNFQVTFLLISPEVFGILTPTFSTKVRKMTKLLVPKSEWVEKIWGDDVVDHVRHF